MLSPSSQLCYDRLMGRETGDGIQEEPAVFRVRCIEVPQVDVVSEALKRLDAVSHRKRPSRAARSREATGETYDENGQLLYNGRACCAKLLTQIQLNLHNLQPNTVFDCTCGARYKLEARIPYGR